MASGDCGFKSGKPATGAPIPIGNIVSITVADNSSSSGFAAKTYFDCVNANGGINGRPIKYDMLDDGWSPKQSSQSALLRACRVGDLLHHRLAARAAKSARWPAASTSALIRPGPSRWPAFSQGSPVACSPAAQGSLTVAPFPRANLSC